MAANYDYWHKALKGELGPVHGNDPQPGFWKRRYGQKAKGETFRWVPVAIWANPAGQIMAMEGNQLIEADEVWSWCCRYPIAETIYRQVMEAKGEWPEAVPEIGSNNPPEGEVAADAVQSAIDAAKAALAKEPTTQAECDKLANHRDRLLKLVKETEEKRKKEKQPHLDAAKAVEEAYSPILAKLKDIGSQVRDAITKFLIKETEKATAAVAAKIAKGEEVPVKAKPKAGNVGHVTALRTYKSAVIEDYAKALEHFKDHADIKEAVQNLANACARSGIEVPGCKIKIEQKAA